MFIIVVYDIDKKRVGKFHRICKKYLYPVQKSVFEGDIDQKLLRRLQQELKNNMDYEHDAVCIYEIKANSEAFKIQLGTVEKRCTVL